MSTYRTLTKDETKQLADSIIAACATKGVSANKLAKQAGVSQPMLHRIMHRRIKKMTPNIERLLIYIRIDSSRDELTTLADLNGVMTDYLAAGGTVGELQAIIVACTHARQIGIGGEPR